MARAAFIWAEATQDQEATHSGQIKKPPKGLLKKIVLASAFAADSSLDSMHLTTHAMSSASWHPLKTWYQE